MSREEANYGADQAWALRHQLARMQRAVRTWAVAVALSMWMNLVPLVRAVDSYTARTTEWTKETLGRLPASVGWLHRDKPRTIRDLSASAGTLYSLLLVTVLTWRRHARQTCTPVLEQYALRIQ